MEEQVSTGQVIEVQKPSKKGFTPILFVVIFLVVAGTTLFYFSIEHEGVGAVTENNETKDNKTETDTETKVIYDRYAPGGTTRRFGHQLVISNPDGTDMKILSGTTTGYQLIISTTTQEVIFLDRETPPTDSLEEQNRFVIKAISFDGKETRTIYHSPQNAAYGDMKLSPNGKEIGILAFITDSKFTGEPEKYWEWKSQNASSKIIIVPLEPLEDTAQQTLVPIALEYGEYSLQFWDTDNRFVIQREVGKDCSAAWGPKVFSSTGETLSVPLYQEVLPDMRGSVVSPDYTHIAVTEDVSGHLVEDMCGNAGGLNIYSLSSGTRTVVESSTTNNFIVDGWTPDGKKLIYYWMEGVYPGEKYPEISITVLVVNNQTINASRYAVFDVQTGEKVLFQSRFALNAWLQEKYPSEHTHSIVKVVAQYPKEDMYDSGYRDVFYELYVDGKFTSFSYHNFSNRVLQVVDIVPTR